MRTVCTIRKKAIKLAMLTFDYDKSMQFDEEIVQCLSDLLTKQKQAIGRTKTKELDFLMMERRCLDRLLLQVNEERQVRHVARGVVIAQRVHDGKGEVG